MVSSVSVEESPEDRRRLELLRSREDGFDFRLPRAGERGTFNCRISPTACVISMVISASPVRSVTPRTPAPNAGEKGLMFS